MNTGVNAMNPAHHEARRRRVIRITLLVIAVSYCIGDTYSFIRAMNKRKPTLKRWLPQAAEIGRDNALYQNHPDYLYPPFFLVILKPLTHLPPMAAAIIWQVGKYLCIVLIFAAAWRYDRLRGPPALWVKIASILVCARFIHSDLRHGNINIFIAALVIGAGYFFIRRRGFVAGLMISMAACIKVTPALWALYMLYRRDWRALAGMLVAAVIALEMIPSLALGPERNQALLGAWYRHVIVAFVGDAKTDSVSMNQSLTAVTNRWLGHSDVSPEDRVNVTALSDTAIHRLQQAMAIALLMLTAFILRPTARTANPATPMGDPEAIHDRRIGMEWALLAPVTLALSGLTWTGHFCLLIPAFVMILSAVSDNDRRRLVSRITLVLAILSAACFLLTGDVLSAAAREWSGRLGVPLIGAMLLYAALCVALEQTRRDASASLASQAAP